MIQKEYVTTRKDGVMLYKTYSDIGKKIIQVQTGIEYDEAIDVYPFKYTYVESENDIEQEGEQNND